MAKSRRAKTFRPQTKESLRAFYELGQKAHRELKGVPLQIQKFADKRQVHRDFVDKARRFFERYSQAELDELCQLPGQTLTRGHVNLLVAVQDKRSRKSLQVKAAQEGWSIQALRRQIRLKFPEKRSLGGKKYKLPGSRAEALSRLMEANEAWLGIYGAIGEAAEGKKVLLPDKVMTELGHVSKAIDRLQDVVGKCVG